MMNKINVGDHIKWCDSNIVYEIVDIKLGSVGEIHFKWFSSIRNNIVLGWYHQVSEIENQILLGGIKKTTPFGVDFEIKKIELK